MVLSNKDGWLSIEEPFQSKDIEELGCHNHIENLSLSMENLITVKISNGFNSLKSVRALWLYCSITRAAMRNVITIPNLEEIFIQDIRHPGKLINFKEATKLSDFRGIYCLKEADLLEISSLPVLQTLSAEHSDITSKALEALLCIPALDTLFLEGSTFDDSMASTLVTSESIKHLHLGGTSLTSAGLKLISEMEQLQTLDIWNEDINEKDLDLLFKLPRLEYLSIGNGADKILTSKEVLPRLKKMPSLKRVWLDGITLTSSEKAELKERYEYFKN